MQNFSAFARTVFKCMKNKQTDKQTFFFIYIDDVNRRLLIFASKEQLGFLNQCESWHCDGTFAVSN